MLIQSTHGLLVDNIHLVAVALVPGIVPAIASAGKHGAGSVPHFHRPLNGRAIKERKN